MTRCGQSVLRCFLLLRGARSQVSSRREFVPRVRPMSLDPIRTATRTQPRCGAPGLAAELNAQQQKKQKAVLAHWIRSDPSFGSPP